jgi:enamine deaminase RidA (YjgF/YER057c/UK114 family)
MSPRDARDGPIARIHVPGFPPAVGPYADVVIAGGLAWISGIVAMDAEGQVVAPDDPDAQIRFALERLRDALDTAGSRPDLLVQLTNYVTDVSVRPMVHRWREAILPGAISASTMVVVAGLVAEGLVYEVEAVALLSREHRPHQS